MVDSARRAGYRLTRRLVRAAIAVDWHAIRLYRLASWLELRGYGLSAAAVSAANRILTGVEIEPGATVGEGLVIMHGVGIVIARRARLGSDCVIFQGVTLGVRHYSRHGPEKEFAGGPTVGDRVTIFAGAKLIGEITVGNDAVIGANAVVLDDVPAGAVVVGVPAEVVDQTLEASGEPSRQGGS